jgi:small multidrug resistance family-3 protein
MCKLFCPEITLQLHELFEGWILQIKELSILLLAALLEVSGDLLIRLGMRPSKYVLIASGFIIIGSYGVTVNLLHWDFSKLLGVYITVFALISILTGWLILREQVALSTWLGLVIIIIGGAVIQFKPFG